MPASTGKTGRGVAFKIATVTVANVSAIGLDGREAEEIDFTHLLSDGGYRELRQGFKDPGSVNLTLQFDPTNTTHNESTNGIEGLLGSGTEVAWQIDYTGAGWAKTCSGVGFVKANNFSIGIEGAIEAQATLRISGQVTWA